MDTAIFKISNRIKDHNISLYYQYRDCYKCLNYNVNVENMNNITLKFIWNYFVYISVSLVDSKYNETSICDGNVTAIPGASYEYLIQNRDMDKIIFTEGSNRYKCSIIFEDHNKFDYLLPVYILCVVLCLYGALHYTVMMFYRHRIFQKLCSKIFLYKIDLREDFGTPSSASNIDDDNVSISMNSRLSTDRRLKGLDSFRGMSVMLMVFVNYGGGGYWFFDHSPWNGLTVADLVFPWFVFVMGATVAILLFRSKSGRFKKNAWLMMWLKSCRRSIVLFIIGVALESPACDRDIRKLRIMGPLQRLSIAYFCLMTTVCVVSLIKVKLNGISHNVEDHGFLILRNDINAEEKQTCGRRVWDIGKDVWDSMPYIVIGFALLLAHACISKLVRAPQCIVGYLGPGGIGDSGCCRNCSGGVAGYIDRYVLTPDHMYQNVTSQKLYQVTQPFDPEGILGCLSCTALCFLGYWGGNVIVSYINWPAAVKRLFIYSLLSTAIGVALCEAKKDDGFIPINKNLWSVSFVMVTAGTSFFLLAFMFVTIDALQLWNGSPFKYVGMNAIVIYCGHILLSNTFPIRWTVQGKYTNQIIMDTWGTVFWTLVGYLMFLKKMFITV